MNLQPNGENDLLFAGFNQDFGCFAVGTETGFRIFNCDPLKERFRRDFGSGGIGHVEMLFRCNILALVGGGRNPRYPPNKVMIWDDYQNKCVVELEFRNEVKGVRLRRDRIVVVLETKVYIYNFSDLKPLQQLETYPNPTGLCAVCSSTTNSVIAFPALQKGFVHVELHDQKKTTIIPAHDNNLSCLALNNDGSKLATSSEKGTLIRVFDTITGQILHEFRRGSDRAEIYSICFSHASEWLSVTSDKGTVHIFSLSTAHPNPNSSFEEPTSRQGEPERDNASASNPRSSLSFLKGVLPKYFESEWSFAQFHGPKTRSISAFGQEKNTIIVICADGSFYKCSFDPLRGGECRQEKNCRFINQDD